jgi:hypothetical protein
VPKEPTLGHHLLVAAVVVGRDDGDHGALQ